MSNPLMSIFVRFASDIRGDAIRSLAITTGAIAFASLGVAQLLERAARDGTLPHIAIVTTSSDASRTAAARSDYDDLPVGSVLPRSAHRIVLDPCTGQQR